MAGIVLRTIGSLVLGFFGGWIVSAAAVFRYFDAAGIFDRDGGLSMGVFFAFAPFCGLLIALALSAGTLFVGLRRRRLGEAGQVEPPSPAAWRIGKGAVSAVAAYLAVWFGIELFGPYQLGAVARLFVTEGIPLLAGIAAGFVVSSMSR